MKQSSLDNLITADKLPPETRKQRGAAGGKASGKARRKKAELREAMQALIDKKYTDETGKHTGAERLAMKIFNEAMAPESKNWSKAIDTILQLTDLNPKEKMEIDKLRKQVDLLDNGEIDPFTKAIQAYIEASIAMDGGAEITAIMQHRETKIEV